MNRCQKRIAKAATGFRASLAKRTAQAETPRLPEGAWKAAQCLAQKISMARSRGWHLAAARLLETFLFEVESCGARLRELSSTLKSEFPQPVVPTEADLFREILSLEQEFEDLSIDLGASELSVTTDPIILDGVELGRFQVCLDWNRLHVSAPYRVVALDPRPAASNSTVTHPHVQDERLCEGEGRRAIDSALAQGRLSDFFLIVNRLLHTYATGSAYVELNAWEGEPCQDCGATTDDEDRCYCECCDDRLCQDCLQCCDDCGRGLCGGCISSCTACEQAHCGSCLKACAACQAETCPDCLLEGVCTNCHEEHATEEERQDKAAEEPAAV